MYKIGDVVKVTGLTARQVRYMSDQGLIVPEISGEERGKGEHRVWSFGDLVLLRAVRKLRVANISSQKVANVLTYLRNAYPATGANLAGVTLAVWGNDVVALAPGEDLPVSTIAQRGQHVLRIPLDAVQREVTEAIEQLNTAAGW